jgi:hypothetical protein
MRNTNFFRTLAVVAAFATLAPAAFAQAVSGSITTKVNLASKCRWQGGTAPTGVIVDFGTYTAFQTTTKSATPVDVVFECTRLYGGTPAISWDGSTAVGVVGGLQYTLSATVVRAGGDPASTTSVGTADTVTYTLGGSMPADQAGEGPAGVSTGSRTLTVTF